MSQRIKEVELKITTATADLEVLKASQKTNVITALNEMYIKSIAEKEKEIAGLNDTLKTLKEASLITGRDGSVLLKDDAEMMTAYNDTKRIGDPINETSKEFKTAEALASKGKLPFILLEGPTGTGKTTFMRALGAKINTPVISINASTGMEEQHLIGDGVPTGEVDETGKESLRFAEGALIKAMKYGVILVIEEINMAKAGVLIALNSVIDDLKQITIPQTGEVIKAAPGFILAGTYNNGYEGGRAMNRAFLNRAIMSIKIDTMSPEKVKTILKTTNPIATENEINVAVGLYESIVNMTNRKQYDAAISIRQLKALLDVKAEQRMFETGTINVSGRNAIDSALIKQVSCNDEDVEKEINLITKKLGESIDKTTGELKESKAMYSVNAEIKTTMDKIRGMAGDK